MTDLNGLIELQQTEGLVMTRQAILGPATPRFVEWVSILNRNNIRVSSGLREWYGRIVEDENRRAEYKEVTPRFPEHEGFNRLWPFQQKAVSYLIGCRRGLLADKAGLGKTATASVTADLLGGKRNLILCPNSLKQWWAEELPRWAERKMPITILESKHRDDILSRYKEGYLIVNWEQLRLCPRVFLGSWDTVIADEVQRTKNPRAKVTVAFQKVTARDMLLLTATPYANHPGEIWPLMDRVERGRFGTYNQFLGMYVKTYLIMNRYQKLSSTPRNPELLKKAIEPYMLRRLKDEVGIELPPKRYQRVPAFMHESQVRAYRQVVHDMFIQLEEDDDILTIPNAISRLTRLRQITSGLGTLPKADRTFHEDESIKLDIAEDYVEQREGDPIVIFSMFRQTIECMAQRLDKTATPYCRLISGMPIEEVERQKEQFQTGHYPVMLSTVQYGGVGHTLTAADTLIFIDKHYNPAVQEQAEDRIHRITQRRSCLIISLHIMHTVDDLVETILERKQEGANQILKETIYENLQDSEAYL